MRAFERYLTEAEQQVLLRHMHLRRADALALRDGALMRLLLHTGMRLGETLALTQAEALQALRTGWLFIPREHRKGKRADHTVLATEPVKAALRDLLAARVAMQKGQTAFELEPLVISRLGQTAFELEPLVISRLGQRMTARAVQKRVKGWCAEAGIEGDVTPHWFRHTRAKNIMRRSSSSDPRGVVQAALGHASIGSTGIYTAVSKEELAAALEEVDGPGDRRKVKRDLRKGYERRAAA
jgi:site-specific recombinase XerC